MLKNNLRALSQPRLEAQTKISSFLPTFSHSPMDTLFSSIIIRQRVWHFSWRTVKGLEKGLSGKVHLLLQKTWVPFPASTSGSSEPSGTPDILLWTAWASVISARFFWPPNNRTFQKPDDIKPIKLEIKNQPFCCFFFYCVVSNEIMFVGWPGSLASFWPSHLSQTFDMKTRAPNLHSISLHHFLTHTLRKKWLSLHHFQPC